MARQLLIAMACLVQLALPLAQVLHEAGHFMAAAHAQLFHSAADRQLAAMASDGDDDEGHCLLCQAFSAAISAALPTTEPCAILDAGRDHEDLAPAFHRGIRDGGAFWAPHARGPPLGSAG